MHSLESIVGRPISPEEFYQLVSTRFGPEARAVQTQARDVAAKYPQLKATTLAQADEALRGLHVLPGTGAKLHFVGDPPQWNDRSLKDDEYVWGLNRMVHWKPLLRAFTVTGDARYAQKVVDELRDWIKSCPCPPINLAGYKEGMEAWRYFEIFSGVNPWRSLEVGIRLFTSWTLILPHLLGTDFLTPALLAEFAGSVFDHGEVLSIVAPKFWPTAAHNHYLMENLGLLSITTMFPEFSTAQKWQTHAMHELERCATAQMTAEGGQIEGCPHYHNGCIGWFGQSLSIARAHGLEFSPEFVSHLERSIHYSLHCLRPSGSAVPWGDSDADTTYAIKPAQSGFRFFRDADYLRIPVRCCGAEEVKKACIAEAWDHGDTDELLAAIDAAASSSDAISLPTGAWQKSLHQATLRSSWEHDALSVFFACRSPVDNGHAHIDPMGFDFTAHGRPLIVDPGRFTYREDADRRAFKSAAYHNTLVINKRDPFEYISSWNFGPQKPGRILDVRLEPGRKIAIARHDNYEPVIHHRAVVLLGHEALLIVDRVENLSPRDLLQFYFHFDSTRVHWDPKTARAKTEDAGLANVLLVPGADLSGELLPGRVSDSLDVTRPSTRLCLTAPASDAATRVFATVIVPWAASASEPVVSTPRISDASGDLRCAFTLNGNTHSFDWSAS